MMFRVFFVTLLLIAWRPDAQAVPHLVKFCGETCSGGEQCNLDNDLSCATNPAVTITGGADFDFKGYTITCSGCGAATGIAVTGTSSNTTIEDTGKANGARGGIVGYPLGISCGYQSNSLVRNVKIDVATSQSTSSGIDGCRKIQGAVVLNAKNYGIVNQDVGDSDYIKDSYIMGAYAPPPYGSGTGIGIWLDGDGSGEVDHNVIGNTSTFSILAYFTSDDLEVTNNMLFNQTYGSGLIATGQYEPVMYGNVCGDPDALYNNACASCISAGACEPVAQPQVVP